MWRNRGYHEPLEKIPHLKVMEDVTVITPSTVLTSFGDRQGALNTLLIPLVVRRALSAPSFGFLPMIENPRHDDHGNSSTFSFADKRRRRLMAVYGGFG